MLNDKFITHKHLKKYLTSQPFFIWNDFVNLENEINFDSIEQDIEDINEKYWQITFDFEEDENNINKDYVEIIKNGYKLVFDKFYDHLKKNNSDANVKIITEKNSKLAFKKTMELIKDSSIDLIVNPVFINEDQMAKPIIYDKRTKTISFLIHSSKTKLQCYIQAYFDFNVIKKITKVENITLFYYDKKYVYHNGRDLKFKESFYCWTQLNGPSKEIKKTVEEFVREPIIQKIQSGIISRDKSKNIVVAFDRDFSYYIHQIRDSLNKKEFEEISEKDKTPWGVNPKFIELFPFEKYKIPKVSGNLLNKNNLLDIKNEKKSLNLFAKEKKTLDLVLKKKNILSEKIIKTYIDKIDNKKCVWYDFEGFSMPYVLIPFSKPYQQLVFQVSVIKTFNKNEIGLSNNIVIDPKNINYLNFYEIIDEIYDEDAYSYIVYNKGYENSRLDEMIEIINLSEKTEKEKIAIYQQKVLEIKQKTVDLNDLFSITSSKTNIPPIFLHELMGFSSIKKIEKLITNKGINLEQMIKPYNELEVQNGLMAMNKAIQRYLDSIGDNEWKEVEKNLKKYCENDVKAMIMVFYYVKYLLNNLE